MWNGIGWNTLQGTNHIWRDRKPSSPKNTDYTGLKGVLKQQLVDKETGITTLYETRT